MAFAFTFSVPSIPNPFSVQRPSTIEPVDGDMGGVMASRVDLDFDPRPRKRTWLPSSSSTVPSLAVSAAVSEPGYLDTPSKYLDAVASSSGPGVDLLDMDDDDDEHARVRGPPTKKRRTIADSIISTALSAALIGAAVGIAAYRVWRDRGKPAPAPQHTDAPPPPYHPGDWVSVPPPTPSHSSEPVAVPQHNHHTLPKAARRSRRAHAVAVASSHRRKPTHIPIHTHHHTSASVSPRKQHFDIEPPAASSEPTEFDEHVDWMGAQLSRLISEGKRALGRDVVLPALEQPGPGADPSDDDDDDQEAWEDEQHHQHQHRQHASSSYRARSHLSPTPLPFSSSAPPRSPLAQHFQHMSSSASLHTPTSTRTPTVEEDGTLSPELREFMAQARSARRRA